MLEAIALLLTGFVGLWLGSSLVVQRVDDMSRALGASVFAMGAIVVAISTDLPELVISITAALRSVDSPDATHLISGNALGSAVAQISLVLGVAALFGTTAYNGTRGRMHGATLVAAVAGFAACSLNGVVGQTEGMLMVIAYAGYALLSLRFAGDNDARVEARPPFRWRWVLDFAVGVVIVLLSSEAVVESALVISDHLGLGQSVVGAVVLGLGTSLPELSVSVRAASRGNMSLSLGNVIGSNTFDLLVPVGVGALITPVQVAASLLWFDLPILLLATVLVVVLINRQRALQWTTAAALLSTYLVYVVGKWLIAVSG